ncbi:hypothetical protein MMC13_002423 [Lambiella insularis]|nr:hypothetical protein [Lambiella insularis]
MEILDLYTEDTVRLREDPSILGVVERTWRDVESVGAGRPGDWIHHGGVPKAVRTEFFRNGRCRRGFVLVQFSWPYQGCSVVAVEALVLVDRALMFGDVVKYRPSDTASGTVVSTSTQCTIQPIYNGLPYHHAHPWPHKEEDNILQHIPGADLQYMHDYQAGDYIIYHNWVGVIEDVWEDVALRLENASIVIVEKSDELETLEPDLSAFPSWEGLKGRLSNILSQIRELTLDQHALEPEDKGIPINPPVLHLGQSVYTKKGNLRRGRFIYGSYDANIPARGIIVDLKTTELDVRWLSRNVFDESRTHTAAPPVHLDQGDFAEITMYDRGKFPHGSGIANSLGCAHGSDFAVGDIVKFQDSAGAAVKYASEDDKHGRYRRVPKAATQGYDINAFLITRTLTTATVQWQDTSTSVLEAVSVVPYLNVDEHDVWPGEIVSIKPNKESSDLIDLSGGEEGLRPATSTRYGVVQFAETKERLARVRWYIEPQLSTMDDDDSILLPGSHLGRLTSVETEVSFYEIVVHPALAKRRGELVLVNPKTYSLAATSTNIQTTNNSAYTGDVQQSTEDPRFDPGVNWFGEVVDLGLDGYPIIRLGAASQVHDIKKAIEDIITIVSDGDSIVGSDTEEDNSSWTDDWDSDSDVVIEETVEYERGTRLDADSDEEMWTTDDEKAGPAIDHSMNEPPIENGLPKPADILASPPHSPQIQRIQLTNFAHMPAQFEILEEPPPASHHYYGETVLLTASLMRRIRKEHGILSSLPEGIWVRTWEDRLDLLRILIIGPEGTPYALAPFVLDFHFNQDFPHSPPEAFFHSWTRGLGRINPNLYEDGKVCLSLLGTWPGDTKDESWSEDSTMLQVLVSLMGLVLVEEPFYNEAGYDAYVGTSETRTNSALYAEKATVMAKGFVMHAVVNGVPGLEAILSWLYLTEHGPDLLRRVIVECDNLLGHGFDQSAEVANDNEGKDDSAAVPESGPVAPLSAGAKVLLRRYTKPLKELLARRDAES